MNKKVLLFGFPILVIVIFLVGYWQLKPQTKRWPITFSRESGSLVMMDIDDLILGSDLIAIGTFDSIPPSRWNTPDGKLPQNATYETIFKERLFMYAEQVFQPAMILKADLQEREILVRSFSGGQVGQYTIQAEDTDVVYTTGQEYLLFLSYYSDKIEDGTPGYYLASGSIQGVYKIVDGTAISYRDEWPLDKLVAYIQDSRLSKVDLPDTPEVKEIMHQIETVYTIEWGCNYDYSIFPTIYANDPRYPLEGEQLELLRVATDKPSLESAGYLDYKLAYYPWWLEGRHRWEEIYNHAKAEKREVSEEERQAFRTSKWGTYPGGWCYLDKPPQAHVKFVSIRVKNDIATVVLGHGSQVKELTLVLVDGHWLIAQEKVISS